MTDPRYQPHLINEEFEKILTRGDVGEDRKRHLQACEECQNSLTQYEKDHWYPSGGFGFFRNEVSTSDEGGIGPFRDWGEDTLGEDIGGFHPFHHWAEDWKDDDGGIIHVNRD